MRRSPLWRWLFALFWGTGSRSFVELTPAAVRFRFGVFDETVPLEGIEGAASFSWPLIAGLGWRTNLFGSIGIVASYRGVIEVRLQPRRRMRFLLPFWHILASRIFVSLEDPEAFLTALERARQLSAGPA